MIHLKVIGKQEAKSQVNSKKEIRKIQGNEQSRNGKNCTQIQWDSWFFEKTKADKSLTELTKRKKMNAKIATLEMKRETSQQIPMQFTRPLGHT